MEFHQLRYFIAAAEDLSISSAAKRLHVTQPALSRQIGVLEAELGVALFDRIRKRIYLTEAGRFFLPKARQIVCDAETGAQQLREQFGKARRTLRLGFMAPFLDDLVVPAVREFRQRHPKAQVSLFELPPRAQLDRLRNHELDAAILGNISDGDRAFFTTRTLSRHQMAALLPEDHELAKKKVIKLAALKNERWVSLSDASFPGRREFLRAICQRAGFDPQIVSEVDSLPMMLGTVTTMGGVALIPRHASKMPHGGCVFVPLAAPVPTTELLLVLPKQEVGLELTTLTSLIAELAAQLAKG
ncbi:LysR substrate-binding domain-containing protein [Prosthecobacter sp.]|uniref:LysR family transcriptional regulator n=1 Tax=Prosthecobacter sp. TaxID=1965333 RepID=UPI002489E0B4|nr:LysR substrate-binding domain-containing protein [Prosthecobacter sp.]MDI1311001.1 LysR substrate-binding domain-containing protein [Prosthecobacter sp.]